MLYKINKAFMNHHKYETLNIVVMAVFIALEWWKIEGGYALAEDHSQ
jgi:hypothetical protein